MRFQLAKNSLASLEWILCNAAVTTIPLELLGTTARSLRF